MFDFKSINTASKKADVNIENKEKKYKELLKKANKTFEEFKNNENISTLQKAAEIYSEALEQKPYEGEPYYYLSLSFYFIGKRSLAKKYLNSLQKIDPNFPESEKLANLISIEEK